MSSFSAIESDVVRWLEARRIYPNSTPEAQFLKLVSEIGELGDALAKKDIKAIHDAIGDSAVVLLAICLLLGVNFTDCLEGAYNEIKDRKGTLMTNGVFVKD